MLRLAAVCLSQLMAQEAIFMLQTRENLEDSNRAAVSPRAEVSDIGMHLMMKSALDHILDVVTPEKQLFFFSHHKTGTFLGQGLAEDLATSGGEASMHTGNEGVVRAMLDSCSFPAQVVLLQNLNEGQLKKLNTNCPEYLAVHFVRNPRHLVESGYVYHLSSWDIRNMRGLTGPKILGDLSTKEGVAQEAFAEAEASGTIPEMLHVLEMMEGDNRTLTVTLEAVEDDYDGIMRAFFRHLVPGHAELEQRFVDLAAAEDVGRWSEAERVKNDHLAGTVLKTQVHNLFDELLDEGDAAVMAVDSYQNDFSRLLTRVKTAMASK